MTPADKILKAKTTLMWDHPFFGVLITQLDLVDATDIPEITTMATDGTRLFYDPSFVATKKHAELVFILAHEVMHNALEHHTRKGHREHRLFNMACDYVINGELVASKVGTMPACGLLDARFTGMGAEEVYRLLDAEQKKGGSGQRPSSAAPAGGNKGGGKTPAAGTAEDPGGCGAVLPAAAAHDEPALAAARADMQTKVRQAASIAKAMNAGTLPADVARLVDIILGAKVDWRAVLRRFVDDSMSRNYSWSRPNKRMLGQGYVFPSLIPDGLNHLVVIVDTSGSIDAETLGAFGGEIDGAFGDGSIDKLSIVYADARVNRVDELEAGDEVRLRPAGGGGTAFGDSFRWVRENAPAASAVIYFTDMMTSDFGEEPAAPVIWAVYGDSRQFDHLVGQAPFGEAIHVAA